MSDFLKLGESLYSDSKHLFREQIAIKCDNTTTSAIEYLSIIAFPDPSDTEKRTRFLNNAEWLSIKGNPSIHKSEACELIKVLPQERPATNYRNAEQNLSSISKNYISKAIQAWHAECLSIYHNQSLQKSLETIGSSYINLIENEKEHQNKSDSFDIDNYRHRTYSPYSGVIHLVDGIVKSHNGKFPHLSKLILDPYWVKSAITAANLNLKARLVEHHLEKNGQLSGSRKSLLDISKVNNIV